MLYICICRIIAFVLNAIYKKADDSENCRFWGNIANILANADKNFMSIAIPFHFFSPCLL